MNRYKVLIDKQDGETEAGGTYESFVCADNINGALSQATLEISESEEIVGINLSELNWTKEDEELLKQRRHEIADSIDQDMEEHA